MSLQLRFILALALACALSITACGDSEDPGAAGESGADESAAGDSSEDGDNNSDASVGNDEVVSSAGDGDLEDGDDEDGDDEDGDDEDAGSDGDELEELGFVEDKEPLVLGFTATGDAGMAAESQSDSRPVSVAVAEAFAEDLNERGGIAGRQVELIVEWVGSEDEESAVEACRKLTQDDQVFAVLNGFAGSATQSVNSCITEQFETVLVGGAPTTEQLGRSAAPWVTPEMNLDRRTAVLGQLLGESGYITELGRIAIIASHPDLEVLAGSVAESLSAAGADLAFSVSLTDPSDPDSAAEESDAIVAELQVDAIETVLQVGRDQRLTDALLSGDNPIDVVLFDGDTTDPRDLVNLGPDDTLFALTTPPGPAEEQDAETARCVATVESRLGLEVLPLALSAPGDPDYWNPTLSTCRVFDLFEALAVAAGPDLTAENFAGALDSFGAQRLAGYPATSLSSQKPDARDSLSLAEWNSASNTWESVAEALNFG